MTVLPLATYPIGNRLVGPVAIPDAINGVSFAIQRDTSADTTIWSDPNTVISLSWDVSINGGAFQNVGSFSAPGGIVTDHGVEVPNSTGDVGFPAGTNRQVQVHVSITGSPVKTSVTLTTS